MVASWENGTLGLVSVHMSRLCSQRFCHNHMNDHYKVKNASTCEGPAASGTSASCPPMPKSSETMMFKTSISMFVGMWTIKASILVRKLDKLINNGVCENLTKQWRDNVMSTMTMVEVKCQTFPEMTLHLFQTFAKPPSPRSFAQCPAVSLSQPPDLDTDLLQMMRDFDSVLSSFPPTKTEWHGRCEDSNNSIGSQHPIIHQQSGSLGTCLATMPSTKLATFLSDDQNTQEATAQNGFSFIWNYVYIVFQSSPVGRNCHKFGNCRNPEHSNSFHISIKQFSYELEAWTRLALSKQTRIFKFLGNDVCKINK